MTQDLKPPSNLKNLRQLFCNMHCLQNLTAAVELQSKIAALRIFNIISHTYVIFLGHS